MPAATPQDRLFRAKLRTMSLTKFLDFAKAEGWSDDEAWAQTWVDDTGHRWSTLSRLGYLMATANDHVLKNQALLKEGVRRVNRAGGLAVETQPGQPDLIWAWLGYQNTMANGSMEKEMMMAFDRTLPAGQKVTAGAGVPGDGGWVDTMLGMAEFLVARGAPPPMWARWLEHWHTQSLLHASGARQCVWWRFGESAPHLFRSNAVGRLPLTPKELIFDVGRPEALAEPGAFSAVWERTVRWATACHRAAPGRADNPFPSGGEQPELRFDLDAHLSPSAWEALSDHIRALALDAPSTPYAVLPALSLWARGPRQGFSPDEEAAVVALVQPSLDQSFQVSPELRAWALERSLDSTLAQASPQARRPRF